MNSQLLLVVIAAVLPASLGQPEIPGTLVSFPMFSAFTEQDVTCSATGVYSHCKDCKTVQNCILGTPDERDCSKISPEKPFCNNGVCSDARPNTELCPAPKLKCTSEGFFPDPTNCQLYHYCERSGSDSMIYQCAPNYVYNSETFMCKQKKLAADCVTIKCDPNVFLTSYGTTKTYYAYCKYVDKVVDSIMMFKCSNNSKFDGTTCVFTCPKEGNFAHTSPNMFYQCYYSGLKLVYSEVTCATGKVFDQTKGVCLTPQTK